MENRPGSFRTWGLLACVALSGSVAWRYLTAREPAEAASFPSAASSRLSVDGEAGTSAPERLAPGSPRPEPWSTSTRAPLPEAQDIQAQLLVAQVRHSLEQRSRRATSQADFSLAPGRVLSSLLERRCGLVEQHTEELLARREQLRLEGKSAAELCRSILFASLKERLALPEDVTQDSFWRQLTQVDAAYEQLVVNEPSSAQERGFFSAVERFREERRRILGPELDRRLFGLSDAVLLLPSEVSSLLQAPGTSADQKVAAWQGLLQRIEHEQGVRLADVMEPMELARQELRLRESTGPLDAQAQRAVLERYASAEAAQRDLDYRREQQERGERLSAFNTERERLLAELARTGLTQEQLRQRMPEIDQRLIEKYHLR